VRDRQLSALLGAVAGAIDAVGWVCLAGLLPSHLTASLVVLGASVGERGGADMSARLAMIPVFVASVAAVKALARHLQARELPVLQTLLGLLTVSLAVLLVCGTLSDALLTDDPRVLLGLGGIAVAGMAVQNAIMRVCLPKLNPTTVMTGNLTQVVTASVDLIARRMQRKSAFERTDGEPRARLLSAGCPLCGFVFGTISCGFAATRCGLFSIVVPLCFSATATVLAWRALPRERSMQALTPRIEPSAAARLQPRTRARAVSTTEPAWPLALRLLVRSWS
jgi:uncharacterized membrane protein YoaK (UPF0700 family)